MARRSSDPGNWPAPPLWRATAIVVGAAAALDVASLLDEAAGAVSAFETKPETAGADAEWRVEAYAAEPCLDAALLVRLALAATAGGGRIIDLGEERLPQRDWLAENRRAFPPLLVGRFFIHGSHWCGHGPAGSIAIEIDAASAFGTGEHPTTSGCLLAFDTLSKRRRFGRPLDIGAGSGILAIAAAKRLRAPVAASDIDGESVRVARRHARRNGVAALVRLRQAPGYRSRALRGRKFDLIFANILARPLAAMAHDLARSLAPGGCAILSGLLRRQEPFVLAAHRVQGLTLERRYAIEGWSILVLRSGERLGCD